MCDEKSREGVLLTPPRLKHHPSFSSGDRALEMSVICRPPPPHLSSLSGRGEGGARRLPPSLIFTSVAAPTPWQLKGGDLTYPDAVVTLRCPEKPWPLRADGGPALWRPKTRAVPNIVLVKEQTRAQVQGLITACLSNLELWVTFGNLWRIVGMFRMSMLTMLTQNGNVIIVN